MKAKRKLIISVLIMSFVLLAAVATIAVTFALTQQNITTSLNIGYEVQDIDGSVYATYTIGDATEYLVPNAIDSDHVSADGNSLIFKAEDLGDAGTLEFPVEELEFTSANSSVVIQYTYSNTGDKHYIASMSFDAQLKYNNMKVEYGIWDYENEEIKWSEDRYAVVVPANSSNKSYWIKISIDKKSKDASFTGDFNWLLEGCDKQDEAYIYLTAVDFVGDETTGTYSASYNGSYLPGGELVIPSSVNGSPVTTISSSSASKEQKAQVTSVYIPESVQTIGASAFNGYANLETVTFEQNETAGSASVQSNVGLVTIDGFAFYNCSKLTEFIVPDTVVSIGSYAFRSCVALKLITIGKSVTSIESYALGDCYRLCVIYNFSSVNLNKSVLQYPSSTKILTEKIQQNIFSDDKGFVFWEYETENYELIDYIGDETNITISSTYNGYPLKINQYAFYKKGITNVTLCEGFDSQQIGSHVFAYCSKLLSVNFPSSLTKVPYGFLYQCTSLTEIEFPDHITIIAGYAFYGCTGLTSIIIPDSITKIDSSAFGQCTGLTSVTFENTSGWFVASSSIATSGTTLSSTDLSNTSTAATYLKSTYSSKYWKRG